MEICAMVKGCSDELIKLRRALHIIPEISENEFKTAEFVRNYLNDLGFKYKQIATGTYVDIAGKDKSTTIALRCDIDALPIIERNDVDYKAGNGAMHACGHDGHTAILLTLARLLKNEQPPQSIRLIFQFGEEGANGASKMIERGVLDSVSEIYALHLDPMQDIGKMSTMAGAMLAGTLDFTVEFEGKASHCSLPQFGIDTIKAMGTFIYKVHGACERFKNNTLLHVGMANAGIARNIVSDKAKILLSLRYYDTLAQEEIMMNIARLLVDIDNEFKTEHRLTVDNAYSPLINSPYAVSKVRELCGEIQEANPVYSAEDFGAYLERVTGCMIWLGCRDKNHTAPLHSNTFNFDERALLYGLEYFKRIAYNTKK